MIEIGKKTRKTYKLPQMEIIKPRFLSDLVYSGDVNRFRELIRVRAGIIEILFQLTYLYLPNYLILNMKD